MAFRFGEPGGRIYTSAGASNANVLALWTMRYSDSGNGISVVAGNGRLTGSCLRISNSNQSYEYLTKTLTNQNIMGIALAIRLGGLPAAGQRGLFGFLDTGNQQCDVRINVLGQLVVTRNGTVLGTSTFAMSTNVWTHLELKILFHSSTGTVELRANGNAIIGPLTAQNTTNTGNFYANQVFIGVTSDPLSGSANWTNDYDDVIVWDGITTDPQGNPDIHDFIGDCNLFWSLPNGAGSNTQWTPDTGSNYARVNEATPDGDTSYVADGTVGDIDTYAMADLPASTALVKSIAVVHSAKKNDSGSRSYVAEIRTGGTNYAHAVPVALNTSYLYDFSAWGSDPTNGSAWTPTKINAMEAGQKVNS